MLPVSASANELPDNAGASWFRRLLRLAPRSAVVLAMSEIDRAHGQRQPGRCPATKPPESHRAEHAKVTLQARRRNPFP